MKNYTTTVIILYVFQELVRIRITGDIACCFSIYAEQYACIFMRRQSHKNGYYKLLSTVLGIEQHFFCKFIQLTVII